MGRKTLLTLLLWSVAVGGCQQIVQKLFPPPPMARIQAMKSDDPDQRREGVSELVKRKIGRSEKLVVFYRIMTEDADPLVRAAAVRSLGLTGSRSGLDEIIRAAGDKDARVRWESAVALGEVCDVRAVEPLIRLLRDDTSSDVRAAAAKSLGMYPQRKVVAALIDALDDDEFAVVFNAERSLTRLTGQSFHYDRNKWLAWMETADEPFAQAGRRPPGLEAKSRWYEKLLFWRRSE